MKTIHVHIKKHLEWVVFSIGLIALALMSPTTTKPSLCLLDKLGFPYCPGEGLGHSIAYIFRGDINSAIDANIMGPIAVVILVLRILYLIKMNVLLPNRFMEKK